MARIRRYFSRIGVKIFALVVGMALISGIGGTVFVLHTMTALSQQVFAQQDRLVRTYGFAIGEYLESSKSMMDLAANSPELLAPLHLGAVQTELNGIPREADPARRSYAREVLRVHPRFESFAQLAPDGTVYFSEPYDEGQAVLTKRNFADRDYFQQAVATGSGVWSDPRLSVATGKPVIIFAEPVFDAGGALQSVLLGVVRLDALAGMAREISEGGPANLMLFDSNGLPIVYAGQGSPAAVELAPPNLPLLADGISGRRGSRMFDNPVTRRPELGTVRSLQVGEKPWYVMVSIPRAVAFGFWERFLPLTIGVMGVGAVLMIFLGVVVSRSITRPILQLGARLREMARVELPVHLALPAGVSEAAKAGSSQAVPVQGTFPSVELESLVEAFGTMRQAVATREHMLQHLAEHDSLTGLFNRRRFEAELENCLRGPHAQGIGGVLVLLDLDNFKFVNDSLGHQAGDQVVERFARMVQRWRPAGAVIARLGGDEFAVLLPGREVEAARGLVEDLLQMVRAQSMILQDQVVEVTCSAGLAPCRFGETSADEVLGHADIALYQAKHDGRNQLAVYRPEATWQTVVRTKLSWEARIRSALRNDRFVLYGQPVLDLRRSEVTHYELLLRMISDEGEVIPPGSFLDVAERFGLIHDIDRWVVKSAIRLVAECQRHTDLQFSVNVSGRAFSDPGLLPLIQEALALTGADPSRLVMEITETSAISNPADAAEFIRTLMRLGIRFAIDDFGAGFSSFNSLRLLPCHYLKIDGGFIRGIAADNTNQQLVKGMVDMARATGKETVAEFVDSEQALEVLRRLGVDYAQGYFVGKPQPLEFVSHTV